MHVRQSRFARGWGIAAGLLFLSVVPGLAGAQSVPAASAPTQQMTPPVPRPQKLAEPMDDFAGLKFTDDQRAKIRQIHQNTKASIDAVVKSDRLSPEQKGAMLQGYQHRERSEVYKLLTPEQQTEVRKRILARREAAKREQEKKSSPQ
jgi:Spy/CpxP family protein refolding chaperone